MSGSANFRSFVFGLLAATSLTGCAVRNPQAIAKIVKIERGVVWTVAEGDIISWRVYNDAGLSGTSTVGTDGQIYAIALGRVAVRGLPVDSLKSLLADRYDKITREAAVDVTVQRDIVVYGPSRTMGIVVADPGMTVLALLARGGVAAGQSPIVSLIQPDGTRSLMPRDARLGSISIGRGDAVYVEDQNFLTRNASILQGYGTIFAFVGGALGVIFTFTK